MCLPSRCLLSERGSPFVPHARHRSMGKTHLILCGCLTDQCVAHTVMDACDLHYQVTLVPGEGGACLSLLQGRCCNPTGRGSKMCLVLAWEPTV